MTMMGNLVLFSACFALSAGITRAVETFALRSAMLDVPNKRSSHTEPTPRGGGLAIAVAALAGIGAAALLRWVSPELALGLAAGGLLVAGIGWLDDRGHVPAPLRAGVHAVAAALALWGIGGLPEIRVGGWVVAAGWAGSVFGVIVIVWLTNLYNFMDGIDGIAAGEAVSVGIIASLLLWATGQSGLAAIPLVIAAGAGGFLPWNWDPARIFMGDVGSGLIGFLFGAVALASEASDAVPGLLWALLLGVFVADTTVTLVRRIARGDQWYAAHRQHAYQRAVRAGLSHGRVTAAVLVLNVLLGVAALIGVWRPGWQPIIVVAAYAALLLIYGAVERVYPTLGRATSSGSDADGVAGQMRPRGRGTT